MSFFESGMGFNTGWEIEASISGDATIFLRSTMGSAYLKGFDYAYRELLLLKRDL
jgi:hypothetical protein